ncbi:uncharacterized protein EV422DRAFT_501409, partial [Fimicolochytrium jonesii]|uniref:uncharacterized protein n=1 Tax=Fimicolochytrium jonesii TaxID=1396493 RepID=UPI0022FED8E5
PSCQPDDTKCFITTAQYTVLGSVVSNNANSSDPGASPAKYNATIQINCVYASFGSNKGTGANFLNQQVTVTGFGTPNAICPRNLGVTANPNDKAIFFISVANGVPQGGIPIFSVFNPCATSVPFTADNMQLLADTLSAYPQNVIPGSTQCALPPSRVATPTAATGAGGAAAPTNTNPLAAGNTAPSNSGAVSATLSAAAGLFAALSGAVTVLLA